MNVVNDYDTSLQFKTIQIWGLNRRPMEVTIDDVEISWSQILYDSFSKVWMVNTSHKCNNYVLGLRILDIV